MLEMVNDGFKTNNTSAAHFAYITKRAKFPQITANTRHDAEAVIYYLIF
jgi:hypothetical protein